MPTIDVQLPDAIARQLAIPSCADLSLPQPSLPEIRLPTGGSIKGIADLAKGVPSDCSLNFSLAIQLAPIMASIECLVKVLGLIQPLIDIVSSLGPPPDPIKLPQAAKAFLDATEAVLPCLAVPTPVAMVPFVVDILKLLIAMLGGLIRQLRSIAGALDGIEGSIKDAEASGNGELLATLQCARDNARTVLGGTMQGIEPIKVLLELAGPFLTIAKAPAIAIPALGDDPAALNETIDALQNVIDTMQTVVDALP